MCVCVISRNYIPLKYPQMCALSENYKATLKHRYGHVSIKKLAKNEGSDGHFALTYYLDRKYTDLK